MESNKKHPLAAVAVVAAVCLAALGLSSLLSACRGRNEPVVTCGDFSLSNTELGYYYWSEYFFFAGAYGEYLDGSLDLSQPLDQQAYSENQTWQDYLLEESLGVVQDTMSMVFRARETGFALPEDYAQGYETVLSNFESAAASGGYDGVEAYLQSSYGAEATLESFQDYLYNSHLAAAYADALYNAISPTEQEIADYLQLHAAEYEAYFGDSASPDDWEAQAREDLIRETYQNEYRAILDSYTFLVNYDAIQIQPPEGLYKES